MGSTLEASPSTSTSSKRLEGLVDELLNGVNGERLLERLLYLLKTREDLDTCHLLTEQDATLKQFSAILKFMQERQWCQLADGKVMGN